MEFIFLTNFTKMRSFTSIFLSFCSICSYLQTVSRHFRNACFPKHFLLAAANHCKVFQIFISKKVTMYIQGGGLRSEKS